MAKEARTGGAPLLLSLKIRFVRPPQFRGDRDGRVCSDMTNRYLSFSNSKEIGVKKREALNNLGLRPWGLYISTALSAEVNATFISIWGRFYFCN